jgi:glutamate-ammonia-ligase adenylyltransferase
VSANSTTLIDLIARGAERVRTAALEAHKPLPDDAAFLTQLETVIAGSDYLTEVMSQHPDWPGELWRSGELRNTSVIGAQRECLRRMLAGTDDAGLDRGLRLFRHREMLRILWRDLNNLADLDETLGDLSAMAQVCLSEAVERLQAQARERWGTPRDAAGKPQSLVVLGMGKLGAGELNVSSDIDLIFAYRAEGETDGRRPISNEIFFRRLGQRLIHAIGEVTEDGFVFRVDMRLRPHGEGGRLALSFAAMEDYYQREGRDWERYALIKARPVAGDLDAGDQLLRSLRPFVYRRYLDYSAFEALREMKALVNAEVRRRGLGDNIKLGRGGIREIEFVVQAFQLIHGGKDPELQERRLRVTLRKLAERALLDESTARVLDEVYVYLRRLENRLQARADQQTHELPDSPLSRARLAYSMGEVDWQTLQRNLDAHRAAVSQAFEPILAGPAGDSEDDSAWVALWHRRLDTEQADAELIAAGFADPESARQGLGGLVREIEGRVSARGRQRIDRFMPHLLRQLAGQPSPDATLERLLKIVASVARRSAYINLLLENPGALEKLIELCRQAVWLAELLANQPALLDELLHPAHLYQETNRGQLADLLKQRLATVQGEDLEQEMEILRQFKLTQVMRIAAMDLDDRLSPGQVAGRLVDVAEVALEAALALAWRDLLVQHGRPSLTNGHSNGQGHDDTPGLAVIAYGRLGGGELGYGSDLDLVFLHDACCEGMTDGNRPIENARFFVRLAQRLVHILTTRTPSGRLYAVDTRLRPSGSSGSLVSSMDAYAEYQMNKAWTWEHQALVRARWVAGHRLLEGGFEQLRRQVLSQVRDPAKLVGEVRDMRARMREELDRSAPGVFDVKQGAGGLADIEFIAQFAVLRWAAEFPRLLDPTATVLVLRVLNDVACLGAEDTAALETAWLGYTTRMNRLQLQGQPAEVSETEVAVWASAVQAVWARVVGPG